MSATAPEIARSAVEVLTVVLLGLMAGFFFAFAADVAPALAQLDASGYISAQQAINRVVRNALFGGVYFGSVLMPAVAAVAAAACGLRLRAGAWALIGASYFLAAFWVTRQVNVPINDALATWNAAAPPADWALARDRWNRANTLRAVASALCFAAAVAMLAWPRERARTA